MTEMTVSYFKLKGKGKKNIPKREFLNSNLDFSLRGTFCKLYLKAVAFSTLGLTGIIPILSPKTLQRCCEKKGECLWSLWATWNKYGNKYKDFLLILVNIEPGEKQATIKVRFG